MNPNEFIVVLCTCPTLEKAEEIAAQVISNSLAGCVNILPNLSSVYRWQGQIEKAQETLLLIKTHRDYYPQLEEFLKNLHPYTIPEIISIPINNGSSEYLTWLKHCLRS